MTATMAMTLTVAIPKTRALHAVPMLVNRGPSFYLKI